MSSYGPLACCNSIRVTAHVFDEVLQVFAGVYLRPILAEVLACILTELQNSEWIMRKAALETVMVT
jgi:hypothetical protein